MSSAVAELEASLQAMLTLKPPGASGSKVSVITNLCTTNIESESVLIQKLYTHFKKAPATHKLGVLYVVDHVTRKWVEQAKLAGQPLDSSAVDGTFGAAVNRVKELLPSLMNDIIQSAPSDHKDKIRKLVEIWEKSQTFPLQMLTQFRQKLDATPSKLTANPACQGNLNSSDLGTAYPALSTTPVESPPQVKAIMGQPNASAPPPPDTSSILAALANMAKQNQHAPQPLASTENSSNMNPTTNTTAASSYITASQNGAGILPQQHQMPMALQSGVNVSAAPNGSYTPHFQGQNNAVLNVPSNQANPFAGQSMPAPSIPAQGGIDPAFQAQLAIIQMLASSGVAQDQWPTIIAAINANASTGAVPGAFPPQSLPQFGQNLTSTPMLPNGQGWPVNQENSRDRNGNGNNYDPEGANNFNRQRSRSRSPTRKEGGWTRDAAHHNRRGDNNFGAANRGDDRQGGRAGSNNPYRQRSPPRRRSPSPQRLPGKKWTEFDANLPKDNIKVLSRTLFVGGVTIAEHELKAIFDRFGKVQTCIVNKDKRHAFVKMYTRKDAEIAKSAMEKNHSTGNMRTRWGVGFGPRDCSDYTSGISVIPIEKLTDADRKWMLSAEYGGTGGTPIQGGLIVEEPDIEIGQGVSSKAISRRMQTDTGGKNGPKSGRDHEHDHNNNRGGYQRRNDHRNGNDDRNNQTIIPPTVPSFGLPFSLGPNGMPIFPPNFSFPHQQQNGNHGQSQQSGAQGYRG